MSLSFNKQYFGLVLPLLIVLALAVLAGCGSSSTAVGAEPTATVAASNSPTVVATDTAGSSENQVKVSNFQFSPATLTVKAGTTVTFKGTSGSHTVTSDPDSSQAFDKPISAGDTVTITFAKAGTYKYHCSIHASMHGVIVVTA